MLRGGEVSSEFGPGLEGKWATQRAGSAGGKAKSWVPASHPCALIKSSVCFNLKQHFLSCWSNSEAGRLFCASSGRQNVCRLHVS